MVKKYLHFPYIVSVVIVAVIAVLMILLVQCSDNLAEKAFGGELFKGLLKNFNPPDFSDNLLLGLSCVQPPEPRDMVVWLDGDNLGTLTTGSIIDFNTATGVNRASYGVYGFGLIRDVKVEPWKVEPGKVGNGYLMNGNFVIAANSSFAPFPNELTVDAWVRVIQNNIGYQPVVSYWDETSDDRSWALTITPDGNLRFDTSPNGLFIPQNTVISTQVLQPGKWYHVAATHELGGNTETPQQGDQIAAQAASNKIYIDGQLAATQYLLPSNSGLKTLPGTWTYYGLIHIGHSNNFADAEQYFRGTIDEVEIYTKALTQQQIASIWGADILGKCKI